MILDKPLAASEMLHTVGGTDRLYISDELFQNSMAPL
jgi:hypothetical protein